MVRKMSLKLVALSIDTKNVDITDPFFTSLHSRITLQVFDFLSDLDTSGVSLLHDSFGRSKEHWTNQSLWADWRMGHFLE